MRRCLLFLTALLFAIPLILMVSSSLKPADQLATDPYSIWPDSFAWSNYAEALRALPFLRYLRNSLVLCLGGSCGSVVSRALVAYSLARLKWRGRDVVFAVIIGTMLLPWHVTMIPRFLLLRELGLYNSLAALIAPTFLGDAFFIFLLRQFFRTIPEELSEAARLDGLSEWGIFWRIVLPLSKPALFSLALCQFFAIGNDFSGPLRYLSDPHQFPLAYGLERFISSYSDQTHLLLAAATMFTLPIVILFFLTQRTFIQGIAATGLK